MLQPRYGPDQGAKQLQLRSSGRLHSYDQGNQEVQKKQLRLGNLGSSNRNSYEVISRIFIPLRLCQCPNGIPRDIPVHPGGAAVKGSTHSWCPFLRRRPPAPLNHRRRCRLRRRRGRRRRRRGRNVRRHSRRLPHYTAARQGGSRRRPGRGRRHIDATGIWRDRWSLGA